MDMSNPQRAQCMCGVCGETPVSPKARYLPGHDAQHCRDLKDAVLAGEVTEAAARAEIGPYPLADQLSRAVASSLSKRRDRRGSLG